MAGIYIHIPFCKQACHYCDFHFSTTLHARSELVDALVIELDQRKHDAHDEPVRTIYFGGGTPSLLSGDELKKIMDRVFDTQVVISPAEITLEANPDDLSKNKIKELREAGINRLSIGIQSFRDEDLKWMNRAHLAHQADYAVKAAQDAGFENITIDLIYSIPSLSMNDWRDNLKKAIELNVPHISAYSLTIEPKTVFGHRKAKGLLTPTDESISQDQFLAMVDLFAEAGLLQYEVSNFSKPGLESRHNSSYWKGELYIGIGPSAHSFDGKNRRWNISNNQQYMRGIQRGEPMFEQEILTKEMRYNEYIMTGLRTIWGVELNYLRDHFGVDLNDLYPKEISYWKEEGKMIEKEGVMRLTPKGFLFADRIASDLFIVS
ncbi:MAG: radical SAM family heme chaperone HemW [Flavobacteriales bacterium]|nr:radical SAM family heme chaperone HemW [Flavobacteriales bacterium]